LSRVQTSIIFDIDLNKWKIIDGEGKRYSFNGTWLYSVKEIQIYDKMEFKIGRNKLKFMVK